MFERFLSETIKKYLNASKNVLLLGPRQVGKSTLIESLLKTIKRKSLVYKLQDIKVYQEIIRSPEIIGENVEAYLKEGPVVLFIDEVQKIPKLMDECQYLIDTYKKNISVILTGSSLRKLRYGDVNLLPGRVILGNLHSLMIPEFMEQEEQRILPVKIKNKNNINISLEDLLMYGTLPGILSEKNFKKEILDTYVLTYLEEEIRSEAMIRNLGYFSKFMELSALESGSAPNIAKLSQETGIPASTVKNYFQILEDTLITFSIPPFQKETRKQILTTPKYIYFDVGVSNAASGLNLNKKILKTEIGGKLFEQFVILEIIKRIKYQYPSWRYYFWRTKTGIEVDLVIKTDNEIIPIEIKYTDTPQRKHIKHLEIFMEEYKCKKGFLIGKFTRARKLTENITAIPWNEI